MSGADVRLPSISAVVLAGGRSRRYAGGNKLLADLEGEPLLRRVVRSVWAAGVDDIVVVTGYEHTAYGEALHGLPVRLVKNPRWSDGMGTSIAAGIGALGSGSRGAFIVPGDLPGLTSETLRHLIGVFDEAGASRIVVPVTPVALGSGVGAQRNPVLWPACFYPLLVALEGDKGGKILLAQHAGECVPVPIAAVHEFVDVDTVADAELWRVGRRE